MLISPLPALFILENQGERGRKGLFLVCFLFLFIVKKPISLFFSMCFHGDGPYGAVSSSEPGIIKGESVASASPSRQSLTTNKSICGILSKRSHLELIRGFKGGSTVHLDVRRDKINKHTWDAKTDLLMQPFSFKTLAELPKKSSTAIL